MKLNALISSSLKAFVVLLAVGQGADAGAVIARRGTTTVTQPDGTTLTVRLVGDERMHFTLTDDGKLLKRDADGQYSYARIDTRGRLVSTGIKAADAAMRTAAQANFATSVTSLNTAEIGKLRRADGQRQRCLNNAFTLQRAAVNNAAIGAAAAGENTLPQSGLGLFSTRVPSKGNVRGLILLVQYSDVKFSNSTSYYSNGAAAYFRDLANQEGFSQQDGTGSARDYFVSQSAGQFVPDFDVYGPYTLPNNRAYYGANNYYDDDSRAELMLVDAVKLADAEIDFSRYDYNNDGYVDFVFVFYAGRGEADGGGEDTVWPHSWELASSDLIDALPVADGKKLNTYACSCEIENAGSAYQTILKPAGIGTFSHEFSHVLGLPDLYATDYGSGANYTPAEYSILDYGPYNNSGRTPPAYSMFERNALGWSVPEVLNGTSQFCTLAPLQDSNQGYIIQTPDTNDFFLLENRQLTGWDTYIPGHGLLAWHVYFDQDIWNDNAVNNLASPQRVTIIKANNVAENTNYASLAGWTFPGTASKTALGAATTPSLLSWAKADPGVELEDIAEDGDANVTFTVNGGTGMSVPRVHQPTEISDNAFTAVWESVEGADDYEVTVSAVFAGTAPETETAGFDNKKLPADWSFSASMETYTSSGNYGKASPSLKFKDSGVTLTTRLFDGDISALSFWVKGMTVSNGSSMIIEGFVPANAAKANAAKAVARAAVNDSQGTWTRIDNLTLTNKASTQTYGDGAATAIPAGVRALRFTYNKKGGNCGLDDVAVTAGGETVEVLEDYNPALSGGQTSMVIDRLRPDCRRYRYQVAAVNDLGRTKPSAPVEVTLVNTGIDDIAGTASAESHSLTGTTLTVNTAAAAVTVFTADGRLVDNRPVSDGTAVVQLPGTGFYIVRAATTFKVVVR